MDIRKCINSLTLKQMDKHLGLEYPEGDPRRKFLEANCDKVEEHGYMRRFSSDEIDERKTLLAEISIQINDLEQRKKEIMAEFKAELQSPKEEKTQLLTDLKQKAEMVTELCYKFIYHEEKMAAYYSKDGELVSSRPLFPDERQGTIFQISRTGTNNN